MAHYEIATAFIAVLNREGIFIIMFLQCCIRLYNIIENKTQSCVLFSCSKEKPIYQYPSWLLHWHGTGATIRLSQYHWSTDVNLRNTNNHVTWIHYANNVFNKKQNRTMCICWWVSYVTDLEYDGEKKDIQWVRYHFSHARVIIVMSRDAICNRFRRHQQKLNRAIERWSRCCELSYLSPYDAWCCQPHRMGHRDNLKWIWMDGWMRHLCCVRNKITQALQWRFIYALTRMLSWYSFRSSLATRETSNNPDSKIHGSTWGPAGSCRPQVGPMLAQRTLLSGKLSLPWEHEQFAHSVHILFSIYCIAIIIRRRVITWTDNYERPGGSFNGNSMEIYKYTFPWYFYWYSYQFTCYWGRNSTVVDWKFTTNSTVISRKFPWKFCINSMGTVQKLYGSSIKIQWKFYIGAF